MNYKTEYGIIIIVALVLGFTLAGYLVATNNQSDLPEQEAVSNEESTILNAIKNRDFTTLSEYVSADKGVIFSPYPTIDLENNQKFTKQEVADFANNNSVITWGIADGSGEPIELTISEYWDKYVYDKDYLATGQISEDQIISTSNGLYNFDTLETSKFTELYVANPENELDWSSLILIYNEEATDKEIIGIMHGQWTI